ncbi:hypothetical protein CRG98_045625 [Punica granatum]|uniref:Uncharacterized protein n=1 Tax=Punica granatum TaxID=22663 RepID=A0A2I0HQM3_PUNGR|nr:hypothetical protein CRG98_045625 [Punica granatum]
MEKTRIEATEGVGDPNREEDADDPNHGVMKRSVEKLKIEKERIEEILREWGEMLRDLKMDFQNLLQTFPVVQDLKDKEQDKKEKKKGCLEKKRLSPPYISGAKISELR